MEDEAPSLASTTLELSKTAYRLGLFLSKLDQDTRIVDTTVECLAGEVTSLSNQCYLVYTELERTRVEGETKSVWHYEVDSRIWGCLSTQTKEVSQTMQELEFFVQAVMGADSSFMGHAQRCRKLEESKDQIINVRTKTRRHTEVLCITQLLIRISFERNKPRRVDRVASTQDLNRLQDLVRRLERSLEADPQWQYHESDANLLSVAHNIVEGKTTRLSYAEATNTTRTEQPLNGSARKSRWLDSLESIRQEQQRQRLSVLLSDHHDRHSTFSRADSHNIGTTSTSTSTSAEIDVRGRTTDDAVSESSEDDFDIDLVKAALDTGTQAFAQQEWEEADSLLQEGLQLLLQLTKEQRAFCDTLNLQYKLAVCAYYTQEPTIAEEALVSLSQLSPISDDQRRHLCHATHLLSMLYIHMGRIEHARFECEKALQIRRKLLGKQHDASLESTALLAHIYDLLNNRARAKLCIAMIPEARRADIINAVEQSLSTKVDHLNSPSLTTRPLSESSDLTVDHIQSRFSTSSVTLPIDTRSYGSVPATLLQPLTTLGRQSRISASTKADLDDAQTVTVTSLSSEEERSTSQVVERGPNTRTYSTDPIPILPTNTRGSMASQTRETSKDKAMSRKEILDKVGCHPKDRIEDAVCDSDHFAFISLLDARKGSWRSKMRKRGRPERVTALHFAALFGEIDMAQRLLDSGFDINEVPYGYSIRHSPLKFAIGARQVDMVEFLVANGAKPTETDSWSILAAQLMNRSWLMMTMSESDRDFAPNQMIAILRILLKRGWDINAPFGPTGATVLHQAVAFWTGSYKWDMTVRTVMTSFLCSRGANPFQANTEGKTPYDIASASEHQELLSILNRGSQNGGLDTWRMEPVELAS